MPDSFVIPEFVMLHLRRGGAYIEDRYRSHVADLLRDLSCFGKRPHRAAFFSDMDIVHRPTRKPLPRAASRFLRSDWVAPHNNKVEAYLRYTRDTLVHNYEPAPRVRNSTWLDRQARSWLHKHKNDFLVIDADKGLGDVITPKPWVIGELRRLLHQGFEEISHAEHARKSTLAQDALHSVIISGLQSDAITAKQARFLSTALSHRKIGRFRLRAKLHKSPVVGRPIANLGNHWLAPVSLFLCQALLPVQKTLPSVITGSHDFTQRTSDLVISPDEKIHTIDAENLYPSIDEHHMFEVISGLLDSHYHGSNFATFLKSLLRIVLQNQCVEHENRFFYAHGIATGLQPGVFLANCYLSVSDAIVSSAPGIKCFYRFVDDAFVCCRDVDQPLKLLNSFHPSLRWLLTASGGRDNAIPFLDLSVNIVANKLQ